jgi:nicotinamidase-related amidase
MSLLDRSQSALVVVDVQEGFRGYETFAAVARGCSILLAAARLLGLQRVVTEQYPKGLGRTAAEVGIEDEVAVEKVVFSAARAEGFDLGAATQAIVCGIETHVCVSQTVLDLLGNGVAVYVPADAVGARHALDHGRALARLERAGAIVTTVEATLFELLGSAAVPEFKALQGLII